MFPTTLEVQKSVVFEKEEVPAILRQVHVRIIFTKIGDIDTVRECFEASVYLEARWREPDLTEDTDSEELNSLWHPDLYVNNNQGEVKQRLVREVVRDYDGQLCVLERRSVRGKFHEHMELWHFPFDTQDISVTVCSNLPDSAVELAEMPDKPSRVLTSSFLDAQEWTLYSHVETACVSVISDHQIVPRKRPAIQFSTRAMRRSAFFLLNIWMVSFVLCMLALVPFGLDRKSLQGRLQLSFIMLLTNVTFKHVVSNTIPRISYQTILDKAISLNQLFITALILWHVIVSLFPSTDPIDTNEKFVVIGFGFAYALGLGAIGLNIYFGAYKRHLLMVEKDKAYESSWGSQRNSVLDA